MEFNKTIFIAIAFGTSVRDVLRTDVFYKLKQRKDLKIVIMASDISSAGFIQEFSGENVFFEKLHSFQPTRIERLLFLLHRAALRDKCKTIDLGNTSGDKKMLNLFTPLARLLLFFMGEQKFQSFLHKCYTAFTPSQLYADIFAKHQPDLVVVTRVLNYSLDYPVLRRAVVEKVPVISLISSWDNLTSKGFFPFSIDGLVVWNDIIKKEAKDLFFFPETKIFVSGIQRYDHFFKRSGYRTKEQFILDNGMDTSKKVITYATGSQTTGRTKLDATSPEPEIVNFIADAIQDEYFDMPVQLIVRLHPQANVDEYQILQDREDVILQIPGKRGGFQDRLFSAQDDIEFGETMLHSDVVINLASTVTIDAALMDTPIVCVNFDFRGDRPYAYSVRRFYDFDHYQKLRSIGGFKLAENKTELLENTHTYLKDPSIDKRGRREILEKQCKFDDGKSGERIADYLVKELKLDELTIPKTFEYTK